MDDTRGVCAFLTDGLHWWVGRFDVPGDPRVRSLVQDMQARVTPWLNEDTAKGMHVLASMLAHRRAKQLCWKVSAEEDELRRNYETLLSTPTTQVWETRRARPPSLRAWHAAELAGEAPWCLLAHFGRDWLEGDGPYVPHRLLAVAWEDGGARGLRLAWLRDGPAVVAALERLHGRLLGPAEGQRLWMTLFATDDEYPLGREEGALRWALLHVGSELCQISMAPPLTAHCVFLDLGE